MTKKKILFVRPTLGQGGADRVTIQLLKSLDRERYQPELALMRQKGEFLQDVPEDVPVHICKSKNLWTMPLKLGPIIRNGDYDIVYSTSGGTNMVVSLLKRFSRKKRFWVLSERTPLSRKRSWHRALLLNGLKKRLYGTADWITVVSEAMRQQFIEMFSIQPAKISVVDNPLIDLKLTEGASEVVDHPYFADEPNRPPVILAAGRLIPEKNFELLLKAFQAVLAKRDARLCILGDGPKLEDLKQLAASLQMDDKVSFPGFDKNPYKYMAKCDVFVLSSNVEGMPGVLIQALACGAPSIATDCPTGPSEIIQDGENGFLIPVRDSASLSNRILNLLADSVLKNQFRSNGPTSVQRFETAQAIETYVNFLD